MKTQNIIDITRRNERKRIMKYDALMETILNRITSKLATGEKFQTSGTFGSSVVIWKLNEEVLKNKVEIDFKNSPAKVIFPKKFCPSKYLYSDTDCKKVFTLRSIYWPIVTHSYPKTSKVLALGASVIDIDVTVENKHVHIKNESIPIEIDIPIGANETSVGNFVNGKDNISTILPIVYHTFNIENFDSGYTIQITPENDLPVKTVLLIDHERMPTASKYLKIVYINELPINEYGAFYFFINNKENNNRTGRFFAGVALLKNVGSLTDTTVLTRTNFDEDFDFNYYFNAYSMGCYSFDENLIEWTSTGLKLEKVSSSSVTCQTSHASQFSLGYSLLPNSLNFDYIFANVGFIDNLSIYVTLIILISLYIIMMIWGYWKDKKDFERRGVTPLPDNNQEDKYLYEVTFYTGPDKEATCESNISFLLSGIWEETEFRKLPRNLNFFRRFGIDTFVLACPRPLGSILHLRVFHDNAGEPPLGSWQLERVVVRDLQTYTKFIFDTNAWLAFDRDKGEIDRIFTPSCRDEKGFGQNLYLRSNKAANQDHMWMSMFVRPLGSRFGRKERVTVCAVFLFSSMLVSALWYDSSPDSKRNGLFDLGPFTFSLDLLLVGACTLFITYPITFLLSYIFKRARPRNLLKCRALQAIEDQKKSQSTGIENPEEISENKSIEERNSENQSKTKEKTTKKCLPWWTRILAWVLSLILIGLSVFLVWSFGIMWGEVTTAKWLSSFLLTFILSILVTQWVKVFVLSFISSVYTKEDLSVEDIDCDEERPNLKWDEEWNHHQILDPSKRKRVHGIVGVDFENPEVNIIRTRLQKEREIKLVMKDILKYVIFLTIIYLIAGNKSDKNGFFLKEHMKNTFIKPGDIKWDFSEKVSNISLSNSRN
ncbi:UNVERIFIED_CONTAM: hypothetical protein GTU68_040089 [Idotea baltica]|nr:hypothetical protein [Idotea baltica]